MLTAILVFLLERGQAMGRYFSWALLILAGVLMLLHRHIRTHAALFSPAPLERVAGAFLVLPADPSVLAVVLFMMAPAWPWHFSSPILQPSLFFLRRQAS